MAQVAHLPFVDGDSGDEGFATVRVERQFVGLALSLRGDGDIEVFLDVKALDSLIQALRTAQAEIGPSE